MATNTSPQGQPLNASPNVHLACSALLMRHAFFRAFTVTLSKNENLTGELEKQPSHHPLQVKKQSFPDVCCREGEGAVPSSECILTLHLLLIVTSFPSHPRPFVTPVLDAMEMANFKLFLFPKGQMGVEFTITLEEQ